MMVQGIRFVSEKGTFTLHIKDKGDKRALKKSVLDYKHLTNVLTILISHVAPETKGGSWRDFSLLANAVLMKAVLFNNPGGKKTSAQIALINTEFKDNTWLNTAKQLCEKSCFNDKNVSMIIRRIKSEWDGFFTNIAQYRANPASFPGMPRPPRAKKLAKVTQASIPLEVSRFSLKKRHVIGVTLGRSQRKLRYSHKGMIDSVGAHHIKSVKVKLSNGEVYLQFTYDKQMEGETFINGFLKAEDNRTRRRKEAGFDVGINTLGALFINDKDTESLLLCGKKYKAYNVDFNRFKARLDTSIAEETREWKTITKGNGEKVQIPLRYSLRGKELIAFKRYLTEKRTRFFDTEWHKLAANIVKYCLKSGVTDFTLSRNLSMTRSTGEIRQRKAGRQTFYQIPFGELLNRIEEKCNAAGIEVHNIDEAYTSKTSSITGNVNANQTNRARNKPILTTDLNGSRVKRGLFKDTTINKVFNSDVSAAVNHIKVTFKRLKFDWLADYLFKLANPIKLKSTADFDNLLNRWSGQESGNIRGRSAPALAL